MKDVKFQVLWKDRITAEVEIKDNKAHIKKYDPDPIRHLFPWEDTDAYHVAEILEGRCWPRNRDNINDLLHACGLKEYKPRTAVCTMMKHGSALKEKI